jgi:hypothetical protein
MSKFSEMDMRCRSADGRRFREYLWVSEGSDAPGRGQRIRPAVDIQAGAANGVYELTRLRAVIGRDA